MLRCRINSANDLTPGGPVSVVVPRNEIFGDAKIISFAKARSTSTRSTIGRTEFFPELVMIARKILQQGEALDCFGLAGADCLE